MNKQMLYLYRQMLRHGFSVSMRPIDHDNERVYLCIQSRNWRQNLTLYPDGWVLYDIEVEYE